MFQGVPTVGVAGLILGPLETKTTEVISMATTLPEGGPVVATTSRAQAKAVAVVEVETIMGAETRTLLQGTTIREIRRDG